MLLPYLNKELIEAGCDEAGRGCLAGAVYAAAVILPKDFKNELLNDSKQLTEKQRYALREVIEKEALAWAVGIVSPGEIDKINILNASFLAMHRAVDRLQLRPQHLLIDGNRFKKYRDIPHTTVVKGDGKYLSSLAPSLSLPKRKFQDMIDELFSYTHKTIDRKSNDIVFYQNGERLLPYKLSSGEKQMLVILLTVLVRDDDHCVLFMDEPEASLHIEWQQKLIGMIRNLNPNVQLILTTHSPAVIMEGWLDAVTEVSEISSLIPNP